jgi:hydroxymethylbilane synthase
LRKLETEGLDAIVLAAAGLKRMGWVDRVTEYLSPDICLPAVGQGLLGVECREDDARVRDLLKRLSDPEAEAAAQAERTLLAALGGSCQVPIGGYAEPLGDGRLRLRGLVATVDGRQVLRAEAEGSDPVALGRSVAEQLFAAGADRLLAACIEAT